MMIVQYVWKDVIKQSMVIRHETMSCSRRRAANCLRALPTGSRKEKSKHTRIVLPIGCSIADDFIQIKAILPIFDLNYYCIFAIAMKNYEEE